MHEATLGLGTWEPGLKGSGNLGRGTSGRDPCQLPAFQQLSALLTLWRTGWAHSIVVASLGTEQDLIIHSTVNGEGRKHRKKRKQTNWRQMVQFHISLGRLSGDSILLLAVGPASAPAPGSPLPADPHPRPAQPLQPGAAVW